MKERIHLTDDNWVCCSICEAWAWDIYFPICLIETKSHICAHCKEEI